MKFVKHDEEMSILSPPLSVVFRKGYFSRENYEGLEAGNLDSARMLRALEPALTAKRKKQNFVLFYPFSL